MEKSRSPRSHTRSRNPPSRRSYSRHVPSARRSSARGLRSLRASTGLQCEAEIGECAVAVPVADEPGHLALADVKQGRALRPHLPEFQSACLSPPAVAAEHEHSLAVKLA